MKVQEPLPRNSLVRVVWLDSNFVAGWRKHGEATAKVPKVVSVGYITHSDPDILELSSTIGTEDGDRLNPLSIPMCSVIEFERLSVAHEDENS